MAYITTFLEGIITFISPCLLPMLPVYLSYFAGGGERKIRATLKGAAGFVLGFTLVFSALGVLAASLGVLLRQHQRWVNLIAGLFVILLGLDFLGLIRLNWFKGGGKSAPGGDLGFFSALGLGLVFALAWTPCVGAFLGSALALASQRAHLWEGLGLLLAYSLGLGIPFLISAVLIDSLKGAFDWIKRHYAMINTLSGILLLIMGVLMASGLLNRLLGALV